MAARGSVAKNVFTNALLNTFKGSFIDGDGKTIRVPVDDGGEIVELKIALTCAKDVVGEGKAIDVPSAAFSSFPIVESNKSKNAKAAGVQNLTNAFPAPVKHVEVTQQEKDNLEALMRAVGIV